MSYLHIQNLYKSQEILLFRECYAMEKIHGTSAHVAWKEGALRFFSGSCKQEDFKALFDKNELASRFSAISQAEVVVFGEAYGGRLQGMSKTYGPSLRFVAFEVKIGELWLDVPNAEGVVKSLGLDFVPYRKVSTDIAVLDAERDRLSEQAVKLGMGERPREGIVLRPLIEVRLNNGERIIAKHKNEAFGETLHHRKVETDQTKLAILKNAAAIADEWATPMRLTHVLDAFGGQADVQQTGNVIRAMIADIERESAGEVEWSREAKSAIGKRTAQMVKERAKSVLSSKEQVANV